MLHLLFHKLVALFWLFQDTLKALHMFHKDLAPPLLTYPPQGLSLQKLDKRFFMILDNIMNFVIG